MFISKNKLEELESTQEIQKQTIAYLFTIIAICLRKTEITPEQLADLMLFKDPAYKSYIKELTDILIEQGRNDVLKAMLPDIEPVK